MLINARTPLSVQDIILKVHRNLGSIGLQRALLKILGETNDVHKALFLGPDITQYHLDLTFPSIQN